MSWACSKQGFLHPTLVVRLVIKTEGTTWEEVPRFDWTSHQRSRSLNCSAISPCWKVGGMLGQLVVSFPNDPNAMGMAWSCEQNDGAYYYKIEVDPRCRRSFQHRASCFCWFRSFNNPTGQSWANLTIETVFIHFPSRSEARSIWWLFFCAEKGQPFGEGGPETSFLKSWVFFRLIFVGAFCNSSFFEQKKCIKNWGFSKIPKKHQRSASCEEATPKAVGGLKSHDTFAKGMLKALPKVKVIMLDGHTMLSSWAKLSPSKRGFMKNWPVKCDCLVYLGDDTTNTFLVF